MPPATAAPTFDNALVRELPADPVTAPGVRQVPDAVWSAVMPTPVAAPRLLAWSEEMAAELGLPLHPDLPEQRDALAQLLAGNRMWPGAQPFASNYGGHQFGHWAGQLGDGRAISLGEVLTPSGKRWELQLKGAGPTPYSRSADGRAVLRSSIREFLCSEAMHHLGVPTTRALALVGTGEQVVRDMFYDGHPQAEPGAIVCRVAPSFLRFGHLQLPAARGDVKLLRLLLDFAIWRDDPQLLDAPGRALQALRDAGAFDEALYTRWFALVCERSARMVAHWMRVGFVHGVMNTDNMSTLGLTIDYGPYGWIDAYDPDWTPNTTDANGRRYRFGWQPRVVHWNLAQLAQAIAPLFADPVPPLQAGLDRFAATHATCEREHVAAKLGLREAGADDLARMETLHQLMHRHQIDMTLWFRALADVPADAPTLQPLENAFYDPGERDAGAPALLDWLQGHAARVQADAMEPSARRARMHAANPKYVLRNYLAQQAIDRAEQGDLGGVTDLQDVMRRPYEDQPGRDAFAARRPDWARDRAGCSMLSCSS